MGSSTCVGVLALLLVLCAHGAKGFAASSGNSRLRSAGIRPFARGTYHGTFSATGALVMNAARANMHEYEIPRASNDNMMSTIKTIFFRSLRFIAPIALQIALFALFGVTVNPSQSLAKTGGDFAGTAAGRGSPSLLQKILQGANVQGSFKTWKAGDTRTEFAALLNTISGLMILGFLGFLGYLKHTQREITMNYKMKKELVKIVEYKEKMYFEAVEELIKKMNDPKYKAGAKETMKRQLKDLDPQGSIQRYLIEGGDKPDISSLINRPKNNKKKSDSGTLKDKPKKDATKKPSGSKGSKLSSKDLYGDDAEDDEGGEETDDVPVAKPVGRARAPVQPSASKAPSMPAAKEAEVPKKKKELYLVVLGELYESLDGALADKQRNALLALLQERIEAIADPAKRDATVAKIAERLGDDEYWVTYAKRIE